MTQFIPADNSQPIKQVRPADGKSFSLKEMQQYVGGYIDIIDLSDGRVMVVNDEAKLEGLPKNPRAGEFVVFQTLREVKAGIEAQERAGVFVFHNYDFSGDLDAPADYIAGDVLICDSKEVE